MENQNPQNRRITRHFIREIAGTKDGTRPESESRRQGPRLFAHAKDWSKDVFDL
ncbi:hypothetical protein KUV39_15805 [Phaeobacter italicus]|uniref:hypothetical protein n=1 Tax=Phaeobacter italicus TaxID=481446 RepID=UPI001C960EC4|nr:hypothetical protein [Phaeobacter italicus]MBY5978117.1 hypothetical protein [Phaeobacter italicus]MEC8016170.1 hypothetical protein [Pseudomonadota bacterium]